jgi:hypothetical protein
VLFGLERWLGQATTSINRLCEAWGQARADVVPDVVANGKRLDCGEAIPGLFMHMLTARHGSLVGVLPGRTKDHALQLAGVFQSERRDRENIVRADLANAWTRYIQRQPADVEQAAEAGIAAWLVGNEPVAYVQP